MIDREDDISGQWNASATDIRKHNSAWLYYVDSMPLCYVRYDLCKVKCYNVMPEREHAMRCGITVNFMTLHTLLSCLSHMPII